MRVAYAVGLTADGWHADGTFIFGEIDLRPLKSAGLDCQIVKVPHELQNKNESDLAELDAIASFEHAPFTGETARRLLRLKHVARFGVGYDGIDPVSLAKEVVVVTTTWEAVKVPMAQAGLVLLIACAHRPVKNHNCVVVGK